MIFHLHAGGFVRVRVKTDALLPPDRTWPIGVCFCGLVRKRVCEDCGWIPPWYRKPKPKPKRTKRKPPADDVLSDAEIRAALERSLM